MRQFCRFFYYLAWFDTVEFNRLPYRNDKKYDDVVFADGFRYQLAMFEIRVLIGLSRTPLCSYCIWNRYCPNHRGILPYFLLFVWFGTVEFNRLPCSKHKMYDEVVYAGIWKICCCKLILAWIYRCCIEFHKALVLYGSLKYVQCVPYAAVLPIFLLLSMIWYCRIQSPAASKRPEVRWCSFHCWILLSIHYLWESSIYRVVSTPSCSYCIWNRYCQNHRLILPNFLLFEWFYTVVFNQLPCPNNKMYDAVVFADRFRYQSTMFQVCTWIMLSRLLDTHIAYELVI